jgi:hypothetical protein
MTVRELMRELWNKPPQATVRIETDADGSQWLAFDPPTRVRPLAGARGDKRRMRRKGA